MSIAWCAFFLHNTAGAARSGEAELMRNAARSRRKRFCAWEQYEPRCGPAAENVVYGQGDTSSGGEAFGGATDSALFTRITGSRVQFLNNLAEGGPAQGGA
jgi:hypothetical protein